MNHSKQPVLLLTLFFLVTSTLTYAAEIQRPGLNHPNLSKVSNNVYALIGDMDAPNEHNQGFICNSVFIITRDGVVVVDPGGSVQVGRMIINTIRKYTNKPITHVIDTHHHADHWMGNHAFAELKPKPMIIGQTYMHEKANEIGDQWYDIIHTLTKGANVGTRVVLPTHIIKGDETLYIGGLTFKFFHPPHAHTEGDLAVLIPEERVFIAGDILFYQRTPGFQDASPLGNLAALEQFNRLDFDKVVPGHGPVTDKSGMKYMINYVHRLHSEVKKYYDQGLPDFEMRDRIDVGDYKNMSGFKERFGINVNRMYQEVEKNSF